LAQIVGDAERGNTGQFVPEGATVYAGRIELAEKL
jgi:hypothetical protein